MTVNHILAPLELEIRLLQYMLQQQALVAAGAPFEVHEGITGSLGMQNLGKYLERLMSLGAITDFDFNGYDDNADKIFDVNASDNLKKYAKAKQIELHQHQPPKNEADKRVAWIEYDDVSREILLNGVFLLVIPHLGSVNEQLFTYFYKHPNQEIDLQALYRQLNIERKGISKVVSDLNFTGDLAKIFFSSSQRQVQFHNPISRQRLERLFPNTKPRIHRKKQKSEELT